MEEAVVLGRSFHLIKLKRTLITLEGFVIFLVAHAVGGYYLAPIVAKIFIELTPFTVAIISSSAFSPVIAIAYLSLRCSFFPSFKIKKELFIYLLPFLILTWVIISMGRLIFAGTDIFPPEIFRPPYPYFYFNWILVIVWMPLMEEILFRGYIFENLRSAWGDLKAMLFSSLLFVIPHALWGALYFMHDKTLISIFFFSCSMAFIFLYSIIFTSAYKLGGLALAILVHIFSAFYMSYI